MAIAADLARALDPVRLAEHAGFEPDDWQASVLRSAAPRLLLNCSRQSGKSTVAALLGLHTALYDAGALVLLVSASLRQAAELYAKCVAVYRALGRPLPTTTETALRLDLSNGSRIISLPASEQTVRGYSAARLLVEDEASRVDDALYYSIRPMLAVSGGRLILMSTPFGKRGHFYEEWTNGGEAWERVQIPAHECPRIPAGFLEEERRALGPFWFRQEYECQFSETTDQLFAYDDVMAAITPAVEPLFGAPQAGDEYSPQRDPQPQEPAATVTPLFAT
jgi:hypothetical protein